MYFFCEKSGIRTNFSLTLPPVWMYEKNDNRLVMDGKSVEKK